MPKYKHPCRYCSALVDGDARVCPFCGKVNPVDSLRCPGCSAPVQKGWLACSVCGAKLETICPECLQNTFFGDYCQHCQARLLITCPNKKCLTRQPPLGDKCRKCGKPLK